MVLDLEYKYKESEFLIPAEKLSLEGLDGWELVSFTSAPEGRLYCDIRPCKYVYLFKRKR